MPGFLFDSNVWIALAMSAHPGHAPAKAAFRAASPGRPALFCRATQQSLLRMLSTPKITAPYGVTMTNRDALALYDAIAPLPAVGYADEPAGVGPQWRALADLPTSSPKRWMDAYLAAFAIAGGLTMVTLDVAFASFPGLAVQVLPVPPASAAAPPVPPPAGPPGGGTP